MTEDEKKRRILDKYYQRMYGVTLAYVEECQIKQQNVCGICGRPPKKNRLAMDHNHRSGKARGLLCMICNRKILGCIERFRVCPSWIIAYLTTYDPENPLLHGVGWQVDTGKPPRKRKKR